MLLAMGFVHPVHEGLLKTLGVDLDPRGNVRANTADYQTSLPKVFSAGDMRRGQSLVVWAIREGRLCARAIDQFLMGTTTCRGERRHRRARPGVPFVARISSGHAGDRWMHGSAHVCRDVYGHLTALPAP